MSAEKKKKKKRQPQPPHAASRAASSAGRHTKPKGVTIMTWNPDHDNPDHTHEHQQDMEEHPGNAGRDEHTGEETTSESAGDAVHALNSLEELHDSNREEFFRMAAVQEFGPQFREALNVLLTLSSDAVQTLAELTRMPAEHQTLIRRALELPEEIQTALRGLLSD